MQQILIAFITGLTTGGLSCLAVQGGLLASSLARQIEQDLQHPAPVAQTRRPLKRRSIPAIPKVQTALPVALFLLAKLIVYTLLGALLGLVGSFLTFDPRTRALLMILIAVFMVGNGLRMLNIHPIIRYFNLEPPRFLTRFIRRHSRQNNHDQQANYATPILLGALTVFIPCGVTQAMMAAAMGTGSASLGAALMFAFTLGTSPLFFLVATLTTQIGVRLEKYFLRFVAIVVLLLGLVTFDNGLTLLGSRYSIANLNQELFPSTSTETPPALSSNNENYLELTVGNNGYSPKTMYAKANQALTLELVTNKTYSCARDFVIPMLNYYNLLPETGRISVEIPPQKPGTVMRFTCSMGMYSGQILFNQ